MDDSYWKNDDGSLLEEWTLRKGLVADDPQPISSLSQCSHCREKVEEIGLTESKELRVWACPVCDGAALEISRSQPS